MYRSLALAVLGTMMAWSAPSLHAQVTPAGRDYALPRAEVSLSYSPTLANAGPGQCGCFFMNGASAEGNFRTYRGFTTVVDVTAAHKGDINNTGQPFSMLMFTAGTRLNYRVGGERERTWHYKPFLQGLVGAAHGFDSAFPDKAGFIQPSATSFALMVGGGVDYKFRRHLSFRVIQGDYIYTRLPNNATNHQSIVRISSGITIHLW